MGQDRAARLEARKDFADFPLGAQIEMVRALTILAEGRKPEVAKPLTGFRPGVMALALRHRGDAFPVVYALRIGNGIRVLHAFRKKSKTLIQERLKRLKEMMT